MPELPEVESLRRKLSPKLTGAMFEAVTLRRSDLRFPLPQDLHIKLRHTTITAVRRRSKYLLLDVTGGSTLVIHLGMSGRLFFSASGLPLDKHDHVLFALTDGRQLRFRDPRRFGMIFLVPTEHLEQNRFFAHLGVEPLSEDFAADMLWQRCRHSESPVKTLLMNANFLVGVGNIYANEALCLSGVRPTRRAHKVTRVEAEALCGTVKAVLSASIQAGGTTFRDYVDADQKPGLYSVQLHVYGREGEPCARCQSRIRRVVQAGRSSFYCPTCQK